MTRTQLVLATAGVAALAGGGTALAAKNHAQAPPSAPPAGMLGHHDGPGDDLDAAATYLGTTASSLVTELQSGKTLADIAGSKKDGLIAALVAHEKQEVADAVTAGRLTQAQADAITPTLTQRFSDLVNGVRPALRPGRGFGHGGSGPGHGPGDDLAVAASYLGSTVPDLLTQLQAGKTLAAIAGSRTSGLIDALVAHEKTELAAAVSAGRLTQVQADQLVPMLTARITGLVKGTRAERGGDGPPPAFVPQPDGQTT
jgi:F0F1-type ATP synthase delta subunit